MKVVVNLKRDLKKGGRCKSGDANKRRYNCLRIQYSAIITTNCLCGFELGFDSQFVEEESHRGLLAETNYLRCVGQLVLNIAQPVV